MTEERDVIPVFIWSDEGKRGYAESEASFWWLYNLATLDKELKAHGLKLIIKAGDEFDALVGGHGRSGRCPSVK